MIPQKQFILADILDSYIPIYFHTIDKHKECILFWSKRYDINEYI